MSGGFNFGQPSAGFTFGAQKTTAATPGTGFGLTSSTPAASGGGFTFGTSAQANTNSASTFSFGTPAKSTAAGGGFSFGTPTTTFGLGAAPQTTAAAAGLTLGSTAAPAAASGFTLGGGMPAQTTAAAPPGGGFTFGTAPQAQPQLAAAATAAPATTTASGGLSFGGFSFGATKVQVTTAAASTAPTGGFSFGTSAPSNLTLPQPQPISTAAATTGQGGGFAFGIKPSSTPAPPAATQPAPVTGFTLGVAPTSAASIAPAATTTAAGGGLSFMLKPLGAATATSTSAPVHVSTATAAAATSGAATAVTATTIPTTTAPPVMTYAQLEGLINKWSLELEDQERHFLQQATQVNAWDRMLVENGEKITALHKEMEKVKLDQRRLNQELDFILSQQKELEDLLCPLEESVKEQSGTIYMQNADEERERTYKLAENVDAQLKRMSQDLKEIIEHLNTSSGPADTSDPLQQICKILNAHMDSLQWIDQNSVLLQRRVEEVSKLCDNQRKEQEKTFRLTFD
uniref:Nuclear pore glycoprotein p62 n=1 Tax=Seriola dumerili TaxID=41447 RepID=A0A3B4VEE6_SERDU